MSAAGHTALLEAGGNSCCRSSSSCSSRCSSRYCTQTTATCAPQELFVPALQLHAGSVIAQCSWLPQPSHVQWSPRLRHDTQPL